MTRKPKSPLDPERTTPIINWEHSPCWRFIVGFSYGIWVTFPYRPGRALSVSWRPPWGWQPISVRVTGGPAWWGSGAIRTLAKPCSVCCRAPAFCTCGSPVLADRRTANQAHAAHLTSKDPS